jgi:hypothetical protein
LAAEAKTSAAKTNRYPQQAAPGVQQEAPLLQQLAVALLSFEVLVFLSAASQQDA